MGRMKEGSGAVYVVVIIIAAEAYGSFALRPKSFEGTPLSSILIPSKADVKELISTTKSVGAATSLRARIQISFGHENGLVRQGKGS